MSGDAQREEVSAGGVVVRFDGAESRILLIRDRYRNWGFPKGHVKAGELAADAARREVIEETGLDEVVVRGPIDTIDWHFAFRGRRIHKVCHFFLMETIGSTTAPKHAEGITACRWTSYDDAYRLVTYDNARGVLRHARALLSPVAAS